MGFISTRIDLTAGLSNVFPPSSPSGGMIFYVRVFFMETPPERRLFKIAFFSLFICLSLQVWWLFQEPPPIVKKDSVKREVASVSHSVFNIFVDTDEVTNFLDRLPVISNFGGSR